MLFFRGLIFSLAMMPSLSARANGNEFFQSVHTGLSQLVYVGSVRDDGGRLVEGALVKWSAVGIDEGGQHKVEGYGTYTDLLGHYHTLDITLIIASMGYDLDPESVEITAEKPGYKTRRRLQQSPASKKTGSIEVDFTLSQTKG